MLVPHRYLELNLLRGAPDAANLYETLLDVLTRVGGLSLEELRRKLVCVGCDGASVLQGERTGVVTQLREKIAPFMMAIHCFAHRTNLVAGVMDDMPAMQRVEGLLRSVYGFFTRSSLRGYASCWRKPLPAPIWCACSGT